MNNYSNNFSINNNARYNPLNNTNNSYNSYQQNTARSPFSGQTNHFYSRPFSFQSSLQQMLASLMAYLQNGSTQQPQQPTTPYNNNYQQGSRFNDTLSGSERSDAIYGYGGNDTLVGGNGNDQLFGGTGNDRLYASEGDQLFGEQGNDTFYANKSGQAELTGGAGYDTALFSAPMQNYQVTQNAQQNQFQVTHLASNASTLVNNDIEQINFSDQAFTAQGLAEHINQDTTTEPQALELNPEQSSKLQDLMGFTNAAVGVTVYDSDNSRSLSVGDIAVINGGITGGEIGRKVLTQDDINHIEGNAGVDQQAAQTELNANRAKWQNAGISDYNYTQKLNIYSIPDYTSPVDVSVRNNQVVQAQYADGRDVVDGYQARTVDGLFDEIQNAINAGAARIEVTYDAATGVPSSLFIDRSEMIADEELGITATNFQAV